jgi:hypothetical protein
MLNFYIRPARLKQLKYPFFFMSTCSGWCPPRLDGKTGLTMRHNLLFEIGVLNLSYLDHFGDVNEMILDALATIETGQFGLLDYGLFLIMANSP